MKMKKEFMEVSRTNIEIVDTAVRQLGKKERLIFLEQQGSSPKKNGLSWPW